MVNPALGRSHVEVLNVVVDGLFRDADFLLAGTAAAGRRVENEWVDVAAEARLVLGAQQGGGVERPRPGTCRRADAEADREPRALGLDRRQRRHRHTRRPVRPRRRRRLRRRRRRRRRAGALYFQDVSVRRACRRQSYVV